MLYKIDINDITASNILIKKKKKESKISKKQTKLEYKINNNNSPKINHNNSPKINHKIDKS